MLSEKLKEIDQHLHQRAPQFRRFLVYRFKKGEKYGLALTVAFIAIALAMWLFLLLVEGIFDEGTAVRFDRQAQQVVAQVLTPTMTDVVIFITDLGGTRGSIIGTLIVAYVLLFSRRWWALFGLVFAMAGGGLILLGLKEFFERARPVEKLISAGGYSFPSGHAFSAMVFFGYVIYLAYKHVHHLAWRVLLITASALLIVLIGLSRVYLNVHWFTDVVGGFTAGFIWLVATVVIIRTVEHPPAAKQVP